MKRTSAGRGQRILAGIGVSPGIAVGPAQLAESHLGAVPSRSLAESEIAAELERLERAIAAARGQLDRLGDKTARLAGAAAEEFAGLIEVHRQMLADSRLVRGTRARISAERINAEAAVERETANLAATLAAIDDPYLAGRVGDVHDVGRRILRQLTQRPYQGLRDLPPGSVVLADELTPADTALLNPQAVAGIAAELGGAEGHTAIMARSLGIPAVLGATGLRGAAAPGDVVAIDGEAGRIYLRPTAAVLARLRARRQEQLRGERALRALKDRPAISRDGVAVSLKVNIDLPAELAAARGVGAEGVGLFRSEFLFMNRPDLPGEDEQYEAYRRVIEGLDGKPVTIRTLDLGGDKLASALGAQAQSGFNPALGLRAIRLALRRPEILTTQLAAILRASVHGPTRILVPMIAAPAEMLAVRRHLAKTARRLKRAGFRLPKALPALGAMIEIPAAALAADALARVSDFFSIGTNDLTMYALAVDRADEQVAALYDPLHPAVLRLIDFAVRAALAAGRPVNLCGEMAGDPRMTALLVGLGLRELSMSAPALPRVKRRLLALDAAAAARRAAEVLQLTDSGSIAARLDDLEALL
ncbi:MAG: phosphoenolpyruvate--protein phosphotransferase [Alphaproteobacteria bacterium]|nr:phosphoenolpyruvate--protein phosphotransferase [Alphaproteobacteria bacterium]